MPLDTAAVARGCRGAELTTARQLCRAELERFRTLAAKPEALTIACTQEAPLFEEVAAETGRAAPVTYVNVRETAGWSREASRAGAKMAALLAAAAEEMPPVPLVEVESAGVVLIYGGDERAIEAGTFLQDHLDVTVLIKPPTDVAAGRNTEFPVVRGLVRNARGHFGAFELTVDQFAEPAPSSRGKLAFGPGRDGARSSCDLILDLSGGVPLFAGKDLIDGYLRADANDPAAVLKAVLKLRDLSGTFEKPRYVDFNADLCAHARSRIVGCNRCLNLCPTEAIAPAGNHVAVDAVRCAGCGQCAAVCPTGAAAYALPPADALLRKLRALLTTYAQAGGEGAVLLIHDKAGADLLSALSHGGDGLAAHVLPLAVNEVTQVGLEAIAAAFAYGASAVRFLLRGRPIHDVAGLRQTIELSETILVGLGFAAAGVASIETDDPEALQAALASIVTGRGARAAASFLPVGGKRSVLRQALRELHAVAPSPVPVLALPARAPFGAVELKVEGCTLCLACVSACPTGALGDDPERPLLRFAEDACVQCGLCQATCPEKVITLKPQIDFRAATAAARVLKEEPPFACIRCGKPFGVKSTIERVAAKLEGKHWMYTGAPQRLEVVKMCDDCRVAVVSEQDFDPYGSPPRQPVRTTEDYLKEREKG
ncbi:MAG TPA: 4Fe-4S dicluster domain-containing protein [Hyphomicrobiaceae bacterium]|nr:4Fe-4S dicluster domain-containing protein [Hyphomicrobiaceae bacterium]